MGCYFREYHKRYGNGPGGGRVASNGMDLPEEEDDEDDEDEPEPCFQDLLQLMRDKYHAHPRRNLLLSEEVLTSGHQLVKNIHILDFLQRTVLVNYTLEVIVTYRRLHEWVRTGTKTSGEGGCRRTCVRA
jgi:hypothetical protein